MYWRLDNDIQTASFLTEDEQAMAIERLRANQARSDSREVRWSQAKEAVKDVKTLLFFIMAFGNSLGSQVHYTFGSLILNRLGYDTYTTVLLNMPFGALQYIVTLGVSWLAVKSRWKSLTLGSSLVPVIIGLVILIVLPQESMNTAVLLIGYHLFSLIFGCNSLILIWIMSNAAGQTKKSITLCFYTAASSAGSALGPLVFKSSDAPLYDSALKITLGVYIAIFWAVIVQVVNLVLLKRAAHEKPARLHDYSMGEKYVDIITSNEHYVGIFAFADLRASRMMSSGTFIENEIDFSYPRGLFLHYMMEPSSHTNTKRLASSNPLITNCEKFCWQVCKLTSCMAAENMGYVAKRRPFESSFFMSTTALHCAVS